MQIFQLQSLTSKDAEQLAQLAVELGYENQVAELFKRTEKILQSTEDAIFIAKHEDQIVAWIHSFVALRVESPVFVEIAGLVVSQNFRKQRIGNQLIDAVKNWSSAKQIHQIKLRCNVVRTESHQFYQNIGFKLCKQQMIFEIAI